MAAENMSFKEAMEAMANGESVCRESWPQGPYLTIENGRIGAYFEVVSIFPITTEVLLSDGWIIIGLDIEKPFLDLIPFLKKGYKARRRGHPNQHLFYDREIQDLVSTHYETQDFTLNFEAISAKDWAIKL